MTHHLFHIIFHQNFVTRHLSHTIFDTPSFTHHLSHTTLSHTVFHTQLCHTPSFTHHLSHTTLSHTIFDTPLCHTPSCTHPLSHTIFHTIFVTHTIFHTHNFGTHLLSSTSPFVFPSFPVPATTFLAHYWKKLTCGVIRSFYLLPQKRCFVRGFHQLSSHLTRCHACHGICTLSPRSPAIRKKHDTRHVSSAAPATQNDDGHVRSAARATKTKTHLAKMSQKYRVCHTKQLSTRYKTCLNVTKCHACHAKRSNATFETSKNDPFCKTYHRHSHIAITRTVANGCGRLRTVADGCGRFGNVERTHPQPPDPPE